MKNMLLSLTSIVVLGLTSCSSVNETAEKLIQSQSKTTVLSASAAEESVDAVSESDYAYTMQDVHILRDYLLNVPADIDLRNKPYDLNGDKKLNAVDLTLMKQKLIEPANENDTLVIYFSRTGNTEKIAQYLVEITGADSYVIEAAVPYTDADIKYQDDNCRANKENQAVYEP